VTRRSLLAHLAAGIGLSASDSPVRLSIGNYGMREMAVDDALAAIRRIGYDGAELCLIPGWPSEPKALDAATRRHIRAAAFPIPTMLESFNLLAPEDEHRATLDRIRDAAALAQDISPGRPPMLQTVLGGRPPDWPRVKDQMAERLAQWARVAAGAGLTLAVKCHVANAVDRPEKLIWLLETVGSEALTAIYDYSHFQLLDLGLEATLDQLLPRCGFITVKDSRRVEGKPQFLLPGEGSVDYRRYFRALAERSWRGWVLVEVSRQLQTAPGYQPVEAAQRSYGHLALALAFAGLRRERPDA